MASNTLIILAAFICAVSALPAVPSPFTYYGKNMQEAEIIALETSGFIVPVGPLVQKIMRDLKAIRSQYPEVDGLTIKRKWVPGQVVVRGVISDATLNAIDTSVYGPLEDVRKYGFGSVLTFTKAYHPEILSQRLHEKYNVVAEPNTSVGPAGNAVITYKQKDHAYIIEKNPGSFSYPGYSTKYVYEFQVNSNGGVKLVSSVAPYQRV